MKKIRRCVFYNVCKSPSKSLKWVCGPDSDNETRRLSCAVFNALQHRPIEDLWKKNEKLGEEEIAN